jgi:cytochrome c-type biogenesis protein CcmH
VIVFAVFLAFVLLVVVLALSGTFPFARKTQAPDVGNTLRELLLARAEGRIGSDEFDTRQAALHAALLAAPQAARRDYLVWSVPAIIVAGAVALYALLGKSEGHNAPLPPPVVSAMALPDAKPQANTGGDLKTMVKRLADKMDKDPNNGEGWLLLARTYGELRQHGAAASAYAKAAALLPPDATLLADWTDAYVLTHDGKWDAASRAMVNRALAADPKHLKALALAGSEAFERADYQAAIDYWKRLKAVAPADSMDGKLADSNIAEANARIGGKKPEAPAASKPSPVAAAGGGIAGTVSLAASLKNKVAPSDTVFVVAKAPDGTGAPLAVKRFEASELPISFRLDDSSAMVPGRNVSKFGEAVLSARVSRTGNAMPQTGDISSATVRAKDGSAGVKLELGSAAP